VITPVAGADGRTAAEKREAEAKREKRTRDGRGGTSGSSGSGNGSKGDNGPDGAAPEVPQDPPSSDPADKVTDTVEDTGGAAKDAVDDTVSALDKAKQTCQENFTAEEIDALGGLTACANAVLEDGLGAVADSLEGILGGATGGLLD
jgi:hypothetical protein